MNKFLDDVKIYSIIEIKNDKNKYCVVGKDDDNSIYIRIILKNNDDFYVGKNKTKINSDFNSSKKLFNIAKRNLLKINNFIIDPSNFDIAIKYINY